MGIFISQAGAKRLKRAKHDSLQWKCYEVLKSRTERNTKEDTLVQKSDTQEWYHLCWERISDAAFLYYMEKNERVGQWLHDRVLEIVRKDLGEWVGPWYRKRADEPENQEGYLETSHITLAICEALDLCSWIFTEPELKECYDAIQNKGMIPCARYCKRIVREARHINNWFVVILDGFGTAAVLLKDSRYIRLAAEYTHVAASLYNEDSYGESVQYSNYATLHLSHLNEVLIRSGQVEQKELNLSSYSNLMVWYASSLLYSKPLNENGPVHARTVNFGDSAALYRTTGDVLVHVANRMKKTDSRAAGLASWMFQTLYERPEQGLEGFGTFGMYNQFQYYTVLALPDCAQPLDPVQAGLPNVISFDCGHIIARDGWEDTSAVVAIQAGYKPYNVTCHRHRDQNSFQLSFCGERMLVDPGHCCYRLQAQKEAVSETAHNTITIKRNGIILEQKEVTGNIFQREEAGNRLLANYSWGTIHIVASDMAGLYDEVVEKAVRVWVMRLPHQIVTVDIVKTKEDTTLCTHFNINNRDNVLREHMYSEQRLVLRRNGQAMKLFEMLSQTNGEILPASFRFDWMAMHEYYHPQPNQDGQGKEGSVNRYYWEDGPGKEHIRIHTYVMDSSREIIHWHVYRLENGWVRLENPSKDAWLDVWADMDRITLCNEKQEEEYIYL